MPSFSLPSLLLGLFFAIVLLIVGFLLGRRRGTAVSADAPVFSDDERTRMVGLLQGLSRWTSEYSGNVSNYQSQIGQIKDGIRQSLNVAGDSSGSSSPARQAGDARLVTLISEMMQTNQGLQDRLAAAEKQLEEQTQQIESYLTEARTDGLTGLSNRRAFDRKLDELFAIYRGGGSSFVLILIDIDHFKRINDQHGHPVGDLVLQRIAVRLGEGLKDSVIVARFGGEEFAILTDMPIRQASAVANELRRKIADEPIVAGNTQLNVTISVGLSRPSDDLVIGPIVRRADESLYAAKKIGRNRVYFNDGTGPQLFGAPEIARSSI